MNKNLFILFTFFSLFIISISSFSQSATKEKTLKWADEFFGKSNYEKANELYLSLLEKYPDDAYVNYKIGLCYFNSILEKEKAFSYLQKSVAISDTFQEAHYFLGKIYHLFHLFDEAIDEYEKFKLLLDSASIEDKRIFHEIMESVNTEIKRCNYGKMLVQTPIKVIIENLGEEINTIYPEYAPVVSPDESMLAFTRRSPETTGGKIAPDGKYFEDIYISDIEEGGLFFKTTEMDSAKKAGFYNVLSNFKFSPPINIGNRINTNKHEAAIQFSYYGEKLYFYRDYNVWEAELLDADEFTWKYPTKVKGTINTNAFEPSVSLSSDQKIIYFSSDRAGGFGGLDLYKAEKMPDGNWGKAVNLGATINTPVDEDSPYIDPDGKTLYFSSKGHTSMGGFDVFKTVFEDNEWNTPQNMGYPLNTAGNDIFFMMTPRYNRAYYSSDKLGGQGDMDLYRLTFAKERNPMAEVLGLVLEGDSLIPANSIITVYDNDNNEVAKYHSDSISGEYLLLLAHGKAYTIKAETEGFVPYIKSFYIPSQVYYFQLYQEIHHIHIKDQGGNLIGQKVTFHNAFFDINKKLKENDSLPKATTKEPIAQEPLTSLQPQPATKAQNYSNYIKDVEPFQKDINYTEISDVKFYISQDSLAELMKRDTTIYNQIKGMLTNYVPVKTVKVAQLKEREVSTIGQHTIIEKDSMNTIASQDISTLKTNTPEKTIQPLDTILTLDTLKGSYTSFNKNTLFIEQDTMRLMFAENTVVAFFEPKEKATKIDKMEAYVPIRDIKKEIISTEREVATLENKIKLDNKILIEEKTTIDTLESAITEKTAPKKENKELITKITNATSPYSETKTDNTTFPTLVILFDFDATWLPDSAKKKLDVMYDFMQKKKDMQFKITGHTDTKGSEDYNLLLSLKRAKAVARYLIRKGLDASRLETDGLGETQPIAPNTNANGTDNREGRKLNRRVEFSVITTP